MPGIASESNLIRFLKIWYENLLMTKYQKIPIMVEAFQLTKDLEVKDTPEWFQKAIEDGIAHWQEKPIYGNLKVIYLFTLEGRMECIEGNWVIRGVEGELYPCKDEIFNKTYREITE